MAVYKNIKAVKSLTNASLTSIVDLTNLNFNNLANGVLDFLGNIKYDEVLNTIALNQASFDFVNISDTLSIKLDNITTFSIDSLGRAEGQELLVSVAETQRLRLTDFNEWPDIGVPGEIIYTGIQNQKQEFGEDFIGYLQSRGWVSLTGLGQNYITLTQLILSPPFPPIPGPGKGTLWIGAQGYETAYEASTQTVYYTDEFGNIFDILSDFVWFKDGDNAKFKLPGKVIIGEVGDTKALQYVDGNQTSGYVLTCDAQGNANWQPINNSNSVNCSYVTIQNFTAGVTNVVTHNLDTTDVVIQLIKVDTNENITGYIDNYQLNTLDVTLSQSINNIKIIILSADCKSSGSASEITYDNTISGLLADDVNEAIDELAAAISAIPSPNTASTNYQYQGINSYNSFMLNCGYLGASTNAISTNLLLAFPIFIQQDVSINEIRIGIALGSAGDSVFGLYSAENGLPKDKLFQSTQFNNAITGYQVINVGTQVLTKGIYFVSYLTNSVPSLIGVPVTAVANVLGYNLNSGDGSSVLISRALTYTSTLPAVWGTPTTKYTTATVNNIPQVEFKIL